MTDYTKAAAWLEGYAQRGILSNTREQAAFALRCVRAMEALANWRVALQAPVNGGPWTAFGPQGYAAASDPLTATEKALEATP